MQQKYITHTIKPLLITLILALGLLISTRYIFSQPNTIDWLELFIVNLQVKNNHLMTRLDTDFVFSPYIAHGGGGINGLKYTNSLEAIKKSYADGFRFIEVDLFLTSDQQIVLLHDDPKTINELYANFPQNLTLENFKNLKLKGNLTPLCFDDLAIFLKAQPDLYIITDHKNNKNLEILTAISNKYPDLESQIIPQIYQFKEYFPVLKLGYNKIILTLYRKNYSNELLLKFLSKHKINILTIPKKLITADLINRLKIINIKTYTHPVDDAFEKSQLFEMGVNGIYISSLLPNGN